MDFALGHEDEAFRQTLRSFLDEHAPGRAPRGAAARLEHQKRWAKTLAHHGFAMPSWPKEWGGMDLSLTKQLVYHEEMALASVPGPPSPTTNTVGPTIIRHGTEWHKQRFLPPMVEADELWCQGFSEPNAGSDLQSLQTRAVRDGDEYVVTGQKLWTTIADHADWMFALVRTGAPRSGQDGITYLLLDMRSEGLSVRPIRDMTGARHFCEVFLEGVRVPVANRIGDENAGWRIARTSLGFERATAFVATQVRYRRVIRDLVDLAGDQGLLGDPLVREELAALYTGIHLLGLNSARSLSAVLARGEPGPTSSITRLLHAQFEQRLNEVALDLLGAAGMLGADEPSVRPRSKWMAAFLRTRASTIGAGTVEVQRNMIGEQVLGLPPEPAPR